MDELAGGRYICGTLLGSGGTATVYRARDRELGRDVALKVFHPRLADDPLLRSRVTSEVRLMRRLTHPGIAAVYDLIDDDRSLAIAMEYLPGGDLRQMVLRTGGLPADTVHAIATSITDGLAYAHAAGVIHRDIKPRNILFTDSGTPRLTDFGLARSATTAGISETDSVAGTPEYTAPETVTSSLWDARSDLYSLGATIFEALTGSPPFTANSPAEILRLQVEQAVPDLPQHIRSTDPTLAAAVTSLLFKDPNRRPQTARELGQMLTSQAPATTRTTATRSCPACGSQMSTEYSWCFQCHRPSISARRADKDGYTVLVTGPGKRGEKLIPEHRDACADTALRYGLRVDRLRREVPRLPFLLARHLSRASARQIVKDLEMASIECRLIGHGETAPATLRRMLLQKTTTMAPRVYLVALASMGGIWPSIANSGGAGLPVVAGMVLLGVPLVTHASFSRPLATLPKEAARGEGTSLDELLTSVTDPQIHARVQGIVEAGASLREASAADRQLPMPLRDMIASTVERSRERAAELGLALWELDSGTRSARRTLFASPVYSSEAREAISITRRNDQLCNRALEAMGRTALDLHELALRLARIEDRRMENELAAVRDSLQRLDDLTAAWDELTQEGADV
jgi:tRNA A-37 threonylcarbamoyl transferase component Bud32